MRASAIPDPTLRRFALKTHDGKRGNLEGAAAFAAFVRPVSRHDAVRALVAYQAIFDYLDTLAEQPSNDPIANGRRLNRALLAAIAPDEPHVDYYAHRRQADDGGYLRALIETCRTALTALPSFAAIVKPMRQATERIVVYQSLNHGDGDGRHETFDRWARSVGEAYAQLRWWETGAAAGSTLDLFALIAAAADPVLEPSVAEELRAAYFPWVGALHSLLDSLADYEEDEGAGRRGLINYYGSPEEAADRIATITTEAMSRVGRLPGDPRHTLIVTAMASFYLCDLSMSSPYARLAAPAVLEAMGHLAGPTMLILNTRRAVGRTADRLAGHSSLRRALQRDRRQMPASRPHRS
jgi:tetraprenyl-beta-curcumene synthase